MNFVVKLLTSMIKGCKITQCTCLNPILHGGGGWYTPWMFIICPSSVKAPNRLIFHEFVPCNIRNVLERPFMSFFWKFQKFSRWKFFLKLIQRGGPFYKKIKRIKKALFLCKSYFFYLNINSTCLQLSFEVSNMSAAQNFSIFSFLYQNLNKIIRPPKFLKFFRK